MIVANLLFVCCFIATTIAYFSHNTDSLIYWAFLTIANMITIHHIG